MPFMLPTHLEYQQSIISKKTTDYRRPALAVGFWLICVNSVNIIQLSRNEQSKPVQSWTRRQMHQPKTIDLKFRKHLNLFQKFRDRNKVCMHHSASIKCVRAARHTLTTTYASSVCSKFEATCCAEYGKGDEDVVVFTRDTAQSHPCFQKVSVALPASLDVCKLTCNISEIASTPQLSLFLVSELLDSGLDISPRYW